MLLDTSREEDEMKLSYALVETRMGWLRVLGSTAGLCRIVLPQASPQAVLSAFGERWLGATSDASPFGDLPQRLMGYFDGEVVAFPDQLDLANATPFQRAVWQMTRSIPYGQTRSYAWVAQQIGIPRGARAVGQALARNPLPLVVPCHRVIGTGGELGGFRYGSEMKRYLLQRETAKM
ncbi:MAG TPA: methylated-DNA--[protein]-cysteine S-methyltransferase [Dehalococcoidia bacterium]|nr:methylated-DNA--[protein]-cysteine S-methyltransferase [Dehalococcoidia bacterium]